MGLPENIDALLVKFDINQDALARVADVAPSSVTRWRNGAQMRKESLEKICSYFNLSEDDLLSNDYGLAAKEHGKPSIHPLKVTAGRRTTVPLRTLGRVHAGDATDEEEVSEEIEVPASVLGGHPRAFALVVEGDCMDRVVLEGYHVLVDPDVEPHNGSVVVAELEPGRAVMRRWLKGQDTLVLSADSHSRHEDIVVTLEDDPVRVIGTVVWAQTAGELS